ncbi:MAG: group III truncated hemoglobin [Sphingobacteriaceae bacterium]|jgi:hemoglobin
MQKPDLDNKERIEEMIRSFYTSLLTNENIKPVFAHTDFERHMPHMIAFWSFVLLDEAGYTTNVFDKHVNLGIKKEHFGIWLSHFENNINSKYEGPKAELAKQRANLIAYTFEKKLTAIGKLNE